MSEHRSSKNKDPTMATFRGARTLLAALPFKVEEAYFFEQNSEMTFSRNMLL
jgi:hypothetical protein